MEPVRRLHKLWYGAGAAVAVLLLAPVVVPYTVDVEHYKPAMAEAVKRVTGRELVIEGRTRLQLFPTPHITARKVNFSNAVGAKGAQMVNVQRVSVTPSWRALLSGRVEIGKLTLVEPSIVLETDARGVPNWEFKPEAGAQQAPGQASEGFHLTVGRMVIENGTLTYTDPQTGRSIAMKEVNLNASVGALEGPFDFKGSAVVNDLPLELDVSIGPPTAAGHALKLVVTLDIGELDFRGTVSEIGPNADVVGKLKLGTSSLPEFATKLVRATGKPSPTLHPAVSGEFSFDGGVEILRDRVAITEFKLGFGGEQARGSLALTGEPVATLSGHIELPKLDADKWQAALAQPNGLIPDEAKAKIAQAAQSPVSPFPPDMDVKLTAAIRELTLRKAALRDVTFAVDVSKGQLTVPRLSARLPGDLSLSVDAMGGTFSLSGKPREAMAWLGFDVARVAPDRLRDLQVHGTYAARAGGFKVTKASVTLDDQKATGGAELLLGPPLRTTIEIDAPAFDLDAYSPPSGGGLALKGPDAAPPIAGPPAVAPAVSQDLFTFKAKVGKLLLRSQLFNGVEADVTLQGPDIRLNNLRVNDAMGARMVLRGALSDLETVPRYDLTVDLYATDADRVMGFLGVPVLNFGTIGPALLSGNIKGTGKTAILRGVRANFLGATAHATGTLSLEGKGQFDFTDFSFESPDVSRFAGAVAGKPMKGLGAVGAKGLLSGSMERAVFNGQATIHDARMSGRVTSTLTGRPQVDANLSVAGIFDLDQWLGVAPAAAVPVEPGPGPAAVPKVALTPRTPAVASSAAVDVSALNAFDARLVLKTSAMKVASLRLENADIDARLKGGTLTVSKLTGRFYSGAVDFNGTVKANRGVLDLDFRGSVLGVSLGQMLRGTAGKDTFGGSQISVAVDGKVDATGIRIAGRGTTPAEIRNSFKGSATLDGFVHPRVDPGSRSTARFFAGIGGIFSDDLAMASLLLKRFINRENRIAGQVALESGAVTLQNQRIEGDHARAEITSRTDVASANTQTTIRFSTDDRPGSSLVTTVNGSLSAPQIDTDRVAAR